MTPITDPPPDAAVALSVDGLWWGELRWWTTSGPPPYTRWLTSLAHSGGGPPPPCCCGPPGMPFNRPGGMPPIGLLAMPGGFMWGGDMGPLAPATTNIEINSRYY